MKRVVLIAFLLVLCFSSAAQSNKKEKRDWLPAGYKYRERETGIDSWFGVIHKRGIKIEHSGGIVLPAIGPNAKDSQYKFEERKFVNGHHFDLGSHEEKDRVSYAVTTGGYENFEISCKKRDAEKCKNELLLVVSSYLKNSYPGNENQ